MSESFAAARPEIQWEVNDGQVRAKVDAVRRDFHAATGAMSDDALRLAVSQEKLDKALARHGVNSTQAKQAELAYRREIEASTREVKQHEHAVERDHAAIGRATRGVIAGSGAFHGFGRAVAFASTSFLGGAGLTVALRAVVHEASRVQEETEKTGVVFGENAKDVQAWAKTLADAFGVSEGAALEAAGRFGNMLRPLGFGTQAAAGMSKELVQLAADMASFNNTKPDVVLEALSSGLAGQVRPLRQYGVFLSQTRIEEEALADGIAKHGHKLTQAQKVQAAYNIILKDTKLQQGDVARNTESLSVAQSKFNAGLQNLEARVGTALLPTLTDYVNKGADWLNQSKNQERIQRDVNEAVSVGGKVAHDLAKGLDDVRAIGEPLIGVLGGAGNAATLLVTAVALRRVGLFARDLGSIAGWLTKIVTRAPATVGALEGVAAAESEVGAAGGVAGGRGGKVGRGGRGVPVALPIGGPLIVATVVANLPGASGARPPASDPHLGQPAGNKYPLLSKLETNHKWPDDVDDSIRDSAILAYGFYRGGQWTAAQLEAWLRQNPLAVGGTPERRPGRQAGAGGLRTDSHDRPGYTPPSGRPDLPVVQPTRPRGKPLTDIQDARLRLARAGDDTAAQLQPLRDIAAYDRKAIAFQESLIRRGIGNAQDHAAVIEQLHGDLDQTEGQIDQINAAAAAKEQKRRAAARKRQHDAAVDAQRGYVAGVGAHAIELRTAARAGGPAAEDAYITFLKHEIRDRKLTRTQRAHYAAILQTENERLANQTDVADQTRYQNLQNNVALAQLNENAAAEKKADHAIVEYWRKRVAATKNGSLERAQAVNNWIAARAAEKALKPEKKDAAADPRAVRDSFLGDVQRIIGAYAPNAFPAPASGKSETHLYDIVHETRRSNEHLRAIVARAGDPATRHAIDTALAVTG